MVTTSTRIGSLIVVLYRQVMHGKVRHDFLDASENRAQVTPGLSPSPDSPTAEQKELDSSPEAE